MPKENIAIRPWKVQDAQKLFQILQQLNFGSLQPKTPNELKKIIRNVNKRKKGKKWFVITMNEIPVGAVSTMQHPLKEQVAEIGYFVEKNSRNKGVATRAVRAITSQLLKTPKITRVELITDPKNSASIRVAQKSGYVKEGLLRNIILSGKKSSHGYLFSKIKRK